MIPRKAGSWVSRKITDKVSVPEFKSARDEKAADGLAGSHLIRGGEGSATGAASNTRADNPPAPPPCEACESHDRKCKSQCSIDRMTHHAEIAELQAKYEVLLGMAIRGTGLSCKRIEDELVALAPKEKSSAGGGGD